MFHPDTSVNQEIEVVGNLSDQIFHAPITYACSDGGAPDFPIPLYLVGTISDVETPAQDLIVSWETLDGEYTNGSGNTLAPIIEEITWTITEAGTLGLQLHILSSSDAYTYWGDCDCANIQSGCGNGGGTQKIRISVDDGSGENNSIQTRTFTINVGSVFGCMNPNSSNYNPIAEIDDGSCLTIKAIINSEQDCVVSKKDGFNITYDGSIELETIDVEAINDGTGGQREAYSYTTPVGITDTVMGSCPLDMNFIMVDNSPYDEINLSYESSNPELAENEAFLFVFYPYGTLELPWERN